MTSMETMQEERIRMLEEHEEEKERLREEFVQEWELEKEALENAMESEKAAMEQELAEYRTQFEREKAVMERRLTEARALMEAQIQAEQQSTETIKRAIRELPPLQAAMELGDLSLLEDELYKWRGEALPASFGDCQGVVEAVVKLAQERLVTWRGVDHTINEVLREVELLPSSTRALMEHCQRLFRTLKEAQLTKMNVRRSAPRALDRVVEVHLAWLERAMSHNNAVHHLIVCKAMNWPQLGHFDFADLDVCLRLVDRAPTSGNGIFLSRAQALVKDEQTAPKELKRLLSHVETMLFFLKYLKSEDLRLTYNEFRRRNSQLSTVVAGFLRRAEQVYCPGRELVCLDERGLLDQNSVTAVLEELRRPRAGTGVDAFGAFREIFYHWALVMRSRFDLLVLPHHTQVVCLLMFKSFLECQDPSAPRALVAQVGTGEGKSMLIAALAIYVALVLRKKAHIVVDDETLLERDFSTFRELFEAFRVPVLGGGTRPLSAVLCVSEERMASLREPCMQPRLDPEADICYCEAKHVQSLYATTARDGEADFDAYDDRVLILDEVDALVIDEEPNEAFVYPNKTLSKVATSVAISLAAGTPPQRLLDTQDHPGAARVVKEMSQEWERAKKMVPNEDFVYVKEVGKHCLLQAGRANPKAWSLALECRNFQEGLDREILFQERLFVMSRPRVFRKYHRLLGLSGSIGSAAERAYLKDTYRAEFFQVPPFLCTCQGSPFHEPLPVRLGALRRATYVEVTPEAQLARLAEVTLEAREQVPVLMIAKDRTQADCLVQSIRAAAAIRGLGAPADDVVRSLSRTLYEADPEQWKENLSRSTMHLGEGTGSRKSFRITVTDPRGGRGTDYRVDDPGVDERGGLLLVLTAVPTSQRDWIQFLGRTSRQDRKGQFCMVLCSQDYQALSNKFGEELRDTGGLEVVNCILRWGDRLAAEKIAASAALYNTGVRANELCEEIFGKHRELVQEPSTRELLVEACQRLRWMSVKEVDEAFARIPAFDPGSVPTEAQDIGRPVDPPADCSSAASARWLSLPKVLIFCLDWSTSMKSKDCGTTFSRFATCVDCVRRILKDQLQDDDLVGVVGFGQNVEVVMRPTPKRKAMRLLEIKLNTMQPESGGGTRFFDAVSACLQQLDQPGLAPAEAPRWLVCLTDGDDLGSRAGNASGELVTKQILEGTPKRLNMAMITVGALKERNLKVIQGWVSQVSQAGGQGQLLSEKSATSIRTAFNTVAEVLAVDVGGVVEC